MGFWAKIGKKLLNKEKKKFNKDAEENGKAQATVKSVARNFVKMLIAIMLPSILGVIFLSCAFHIIEDKFTEDTSSSYSSAIGKTTGTVTSASGSTSGDEFDIIEPSIKVKPGENGRYVIEYDITEEDIENLWSILKEEDYSDLTEENIKFIAALVKHGYPLEEHAMYRKKEYLQLMFLFFKAEVASQSLDLRPVDEMYVDGNYNPPSFEEEGIPGIIRVNKYRINPENTEIIETQLSYISESEFNENTEGHFTINESGNLVVANTTETKVEYDPEGYIDEHEVNETIYNTTFNQINYKSVIEKSSLPFELMLILMAYLNDEEFDRNMANTVIESSIVLALKEEETEKITKTIKTYTPRIEEYYDFTYVVSYILNSSHTTTYIEDNVASIGQARALLRVRYGYTGMFLSGEDEWEWENSQYKATYNSNDKTLRIEKTVLEGNTDTEAGKEEPLKPELGKNYTKLYEEDTVNVTETITIKTYKQELEIKEVKNWFMNYNIESYTGSSETIPGEPVETIIPQEEYLGKEDSEEYKKEENGFSKEPLPEDEIMSNYKTQKEQEITDNLSGASNFTWNITGNVYKHLENVLTKTNATTTTTTTVINNGESEAEYRTQESEGSLLYYLDISSSAKTNLSSATEMIKTALEKNASTIDQVNILKYLLYLYTGNKDFNVDPIDLSTLVGTIDFANFGGNGIYMFLYQFEHGNNPIPIDASGKYYKMYGDSAGNATIGMGMQWKSQVDKFNVSGTVLLSDGVTESSVPNIAEYVREKLGGSHDAKHSNEEIDAIGIYLDKEMVDQVVKEAIDEWVRLVDNETGSLGLSQQQRFALIELCYGRGGYGLDWQGFRNAYNVAGVEKNSPEQLKKIWDEWWVKAGIGPNTLSGVLKGQDAAFETYVKGTADFSNPWTPTGRGSNGDNVFDRKYYLFFTEEQRQTFVNRNVPTVRPDYEDEIFIYEENTSIGSEISNEGFLAVAEELWRRVCLSNPKPEYSGTENWENILHGNPISVIKCSGYVSGVVYNYGYTSVGKLSTHGWIDLDLSGIGVEVASGNGPDDIRSYLQPGDIVVRLDPGSDPKGHMNIVVSIEDGRVMTYDCGGKKNWANCNGEPIDKTNFFKTNTHRKGRWRIIRLNPIN